MPRHVVFVGADVFDIYVEFVRGLKEAGVTVSAVGHTPKARVAPRLLYFADHYHRVGSLLDPASVLAGIREIDRLRTVDRIETADESLVMVAAQTREAMELPGLSVHSATLCRDKPSMKEALRQAGVPTAASAGVDSVADLEAFAERIGYPLVLKPRAALGSLGTFRVESRSELYSAASRLRVDQGESIAVEEFIEGEEGFYDTISIDGEPALEFISHYYPNVLEALSTRHLAPQIAATNRVEHPMYTDLREMGRRVNTALGIGTSATHMEWFRTSKGLRFSEIGARPPGEKLWNLYCVGNDIDLYRQWAIAIVYGQAGARPSRRFATGSVQVRPDRDGVVVGIQGLQAVLDRYRANIWAWSLPKAGTPTDPIHKGYLNNLWMRLRHPDVDELRRMMDFVGSTVELRARAA